MHESLWQRIDAALDARRDPFDDPDLTHELQQDPEAVAQVRRLMMRLDVLSNDPTLVSPTHPRRRRCRGCLALLRGPAHRRSLVGSAPEPPERDERPHDRNRVAHRRTHDPAARSR